jgi:hypothetical protein
MRLHDPPVRATSFPARNDQAILMSLNEHEAD